MKKYLLIFLFSLITTIGFSQIPFVSIQDMEKAVKTLVELIQIWEKH